MKCEIYDAWKNSVVERGLSYPAAKRFLEQNEPPYNPRVGCRYYILPGSICLSR